MNELLVFTPTVQRQVGFLFESISSNQVLFEHVDERITRGRILIKQYALILLVESLLYMSQVLGHFQDWQKGFAYPIVQLVQIVFNLKADKEAEFVSKSNENAFRCEESQLKSCSKA